MAGLESNKTLDFDPEDLTIAELEELEDAVGKAIGKLFAEFQTQDFSAKSVKAMIWIIKRRENPGLTLEEASKFKLSELFKPEENGQKPNPT